MWWVSGITSTVTHGTLAGMECGVETMAEVCTRKRHAHGTMSPNVALRDECWCWCAQLHHKREKCVYWIYTIIFSWAGLCWCESGGGQCVSVCMYVSVCVCVKGERTRERCGKVDRSTLGAHCDWSQMLRWNENNSTRTATAKTPRRFADWG